jgi:hypothetical protein
LKEEENPFAQQPMLPAERSCGYRQHDQPAEVVIVSLAA